VSALLPLHRKEGPSRALCPSALLPESGGESTHEPQSSQRFLGLTLLSFPRLALLTPLDQLDRRDDLRNSWYMARSRRSSLAGGIYGYGIEVWRRLEGRERMCTSAMLDVEILGVAFCDSPPVEPIVWEILCQMDRKSRS
jgi:hypothetical protein